MSEINTLVYFDIEATGLKSSGRPRITEVSLVAVNTKDVSEMHSSLLSHLSKLEDKIILPRIINKLTICVYPMAIIRPEVSDMTGLDNFNLSGQDTFNQRTGELINSFLAHLPSPLCLVAHNGNQYDFPLLKAELKKVGVTLPCDTLCADSYLGIKEIFKKREEVQHSQNENYRQTRDSQIIKGVADTIKNRNLTKMDKECQEIEIENSKTPKINSVITPTCKLNRMNAVQRRTRLKGTGMLTVRRKLDFIRCESPKSYSLINLHRQLLGWLPAQSHGAEADCMSLLRITAVLGTEWVQWVQDNCNLFSQFTEMWTYKHC